MDPQFGVQDIPLGDGLDPAPILVNIEIMLDMGFLAKLVTLFQEGHGGEERVEQGGGEPARDQVPGGGMSFMDLMEEGVGGGSDIDLLAGQHTYIERGGRVDEDGVECVVEGFVRVGMGEHEIVLEDETGTGGLGGLGDGVGLHEVVQGGEVAHSTPICSPFGGIHPRDTYEFMWGAVDTLHFFEELGFTVVTAVEINIIDDIDMGVPRGGVGGAGGHVGGVRGSRVLYHHGFIWIWADRVLGELLGRFEGALSGKWLLGEFLEGVLATRTTVVFVGHIHLMVQFLVAVVDLPSSDGLGGCPGEEGFQKGGEGEIFHHISIYDLGDRLYG